MSSITCSEALIKWTTDNYDSLPKEDWNFVGEKRLKVLETGHTKARNWKRRAIKKDGTRVYRLFECTESMFALSLMFLVVEDEADFTYKHIMAGTRKDFEKYFNSIGYNWGGWS